MRIKVLTGLALCISLAACSSEGSNNSDRESDNGWVLQQEINKFTDQNIAYAQKVFVLENAQISVELRCKHTSITYTVTAFDSEETGLDFKTNSGWDYYGKPYNNTPVTMRFDDNKAFTFSAPVKRYTNQITILPRFEQQEIAEAKIALLRLDFLDRTIDLEIDHISSAIDGVIRPCVEQHNKNAEQARIDQENKQADVKANIEALYSDDTVSSDDLRSRLENNDIEPDENRLRQKAARENAEKRKLEAEKITRERAKQKEIDEYNQQRDLERQRRLDEVARRNAEVKAKSEKVQREADNHLRELEQISKEQRAQY